VVLLIDENLPNQFRHCKFAELFALPNPRSIIFNRLVLCSPALEFDLLITPSPSIACFCGCFSSENRSIMSAARVPPIGYLGTL
jgi:hypothetical protein